MDMAMTKIKVAIPAEKLVAMNMIHVDKEEYCQKLRELDGSIRMTYL